MKISALLREAQKGPALSLDQDLMQRAMLRFPGYDSQQALSLYIADKAAQQQKTDAAQNNLINTQQNAIKTIGKELNDYEAQAQDTDREVERLKQLSGTLTAGSADRQQKAKVSADELEKLQKELEALKTKPGMDNEKFKELEAQVMAMANSPAANDSSVQQIQNMLAAVQKKQSIGDEQFNMLVSKLKDTEEKLQSKELRFQASLNRNAEKFEKNASEFRKYADIVDGYKNKIDSFDDFMNKEKENILALRGEIQQQAQEIEDMAGGLSQTLSFVKPLLKRNPAAVAQNAIDNAQASSQSALQNQPGGYQLPDIEPDDYDDEPELFGDEEEEPNVKYNYESKIFEESNRPVGPVLDHDSDTENWLIKYLPQMVREFKKTFAIALSRKNPTYNDHQIAYAIEDNINILFSHDENPISRSTMNGFYSLVKNELFQQAPETSTVHMKQNDLFSESLDKTYSRMLDKLIGLPYIKG